MHFSLYKQLMVIKQKNLQQPKCKVDSEAMQTLLFNCVLYNVTNHVMNLIGFVLNLIIMAHIQ